MADEKKGGLAQALPPAQFTNLAQVNHTNHEFFLEFAQTSGRVLMQDPVRGVIEAQLIARLVMTPQHAKQLLAALQANVKKYEEKFGAIRILEPGQAN